jgi:hypothetical protein
MLNFTAIGVILLRMCILELRDLSAFTLMVA